MVNSERKPIFAIKEDMITANKYFNTTWDKYRRGVVVRGLLKHGLKEQTVSDEGQLQAEVNHGRWIVKCECNGAEIMWEESLFMCQSCWNGKHKHQYRKAVFPEARAQIEELLLKRPLENRNWRSGETLEQLEAENQEHKEELL